MKKFLFTLMALASITLTGCSEFHAIPAGFVGKILTPTGWAKEIIEAGQVDLGSTDGTNGQQNTLTILEATTVSLKESFLNDATNNVDNRVKIGNMPVTVDIYVRMKVPSDDKKRSAIFAQITPSIKKDKVSTIMVNDVYTKFAKMDVRSAIRQVLCEYKSVEDVVKNQAAVNDRLGKEILAMFERSGVPLDLQNVTISNIQEDISILAAENKKQSALSEIETIRMTGKAIRENPEYLIMKKYETYEKMAAKGTTIYIIDGDDRKLTIPTK